MSNYLLGGLGDDAWRYMLGVEAVPAALYLILIIGVPNREIIKLLITDLKPESMLKYLSIIVNQDSK